MIQEKVQRTDMIYPSDYIQFQKDSLDMGKSVSERIEEFIQSENKYHKKPKKKGGKRR